MQPRRISPTLSIGTDEWHNDEEVLGAIES